MAFLFVFVTKLAKQVYNMSKINPILAYEVKIHQILPKI